MEEAEETSSSENKTIFDIGDYNLYQIMSYLSLNDKLQLGLLDHRFDDCLKRFLMKDMFNMSEVVVKFRKNKTQQIFQRYGGMIKRLSLELMCYKDDFYHKLTSRYCKDLHELRCSCLRPITANVSLELLENSKTLDSLDIFDWSNSHDVSPETIVAKISTLSALTRLSLSYSVTTGQYLGNLTNLKFLNLENCWDLKPEYFIEICIANKLQILNIKGCGKLNNLAFQTLVNSQTKLYELTVGGNYLATNVEIVADLPQLKTFRIDVSDPPEVLRYLTKLAEVKHESLECICASNLISDTGGAYYGYDPLDDNIAKPIIGSIVQFKKLKELHLPTNSFINSERLQRIARACTELNVLNIVGSNKIDGDTILDTVRDLQYLHTLNIGGCVWGDFDFYDRLYKAVKSRNTFKLAVYGIYCTSLQLFMDSLEYKVRSHYLEIKNYSTRDFMKEKYRKCGNSRINAYRIDSGLVASSELSLFHLPDKIIRFFLSFMDPVDKLKLLLVHSRFHSLVTESLTEDKVNLNEFIRFFTFDDTRSVLSICSENMENISFNFKDGLKPVEYVHILESYKKDFAVINVDSYPENYVEDCFFQFD